MSLLREIQNAAVDADANLATLLRKCKILAARLGNSEFKQWVENELDGYQGKPDLPNYRILRVNSKGHFSGAFGRVLRNADMPLLCLPEEARETMGHSYLREPVAALQALVAQCAKGVAQEPWDPNLVMMFARMFYEGMYCAQAWKVIPITQVISALDAIRNKILNFALEIEAEAPDAGEAPINSNPLPQEKIHQIFNTYISGRVDNLATGSSEFSQTVSKTGSDAEVFSKLLGAIHSLNDQRLAAQMTPSIEKMQVTQGTQGFKQHYLNFTSLLADHMQILGPVIGPFLPALAGLIR